MISLATSFPEQGAGEVGRSATSVVEVFRRRAAQDADRTAFTFLGEVDAPPIDWSYAELDLRARAIAARLQAIGRRGDRALLMYDTGLDYIAALAGCLYAGVVAVPVYPPDPMRAARTWPRLEAIVRDAQATVVLGTSNDLAWAGTMLGQLPGLKHLLATDAIEPALADQWRPIEIDRDTLAFLQYTSGSTSTPKGVMVRHGNLLANLAQMEARIDVADAVGCTWLPAYHDMGLIGAIFQCWYSGRRNVMLSPLSFFQQPIRWLRAISDYRATSTGAPDFAYELCVRKVRRDDCAGLDLGCLQFTLSGAEPVRAATIERFVEKFAEFGLRRNCFCPSYGLAEATLMVASAAPGDGPSVVPFDGAELAHGRAVRVEQSTDDRARTLVSCGRATDGQRVTIVDPGTRETLADGHVGEIWTSGANVAAGYWGRERESNETFRARTADCDGPFLRTGDLGFFDRGQLFVAGRLKDLIIVRGRNHHPQDIEQTVESCHEALKPHGGAAFSIDDEQRERVVVVHEMSRPNRYDLDEVAKRIQQAVLEQHDLVVDAVALIRQGSLPKTTSGKVQRHIAREKFAAGALNVIHVAEVERAAPVAGDRAAAYVAPRNHLERELAELWAEVLGVEGVGVCDHFLDLGGHSLLAAQLANRLRSRFGVELPLGELFERPTVATLAELIAARRAEASLDPFASEDADAELRLLEDLEGMSDDEAEALLAARQRHANESGSAAPSPSNGGHTGRGYAAWSSADWNALENPEPQH